jgi:hypothetical protein
VKKMNKMSESEKIGYLVVACRQTKMGALTTIHGEKFNVSKTGNHWLERLPVKVGEEVIITDISNSGKHYCKKIRIIEVEPAVNWEIVEQAEPYCQFCGGH